MKIKLHKISKSVEPSLQVMGVQWDDQRSAMSQLEIEAVEKQDKENRDQEHSAYESWKNDWMAKTGDGPSEEQIKKYDYDDGFECRASAAWEAEQALRSRNVTAAAACHEGYRLLMCEFWLLGTNDDGPMSKPDSAVRMRLPIAMPNGSITLVFESKKSQIFWGGSQSIKTFLENKIPVSGTISDEWVSGFIETIYSFSDEPVVIVKLHKGSQKSADLIARAYNDLNDLRLPDELPVALAAADACFNCGRALNDQISKVLRIGPICAKNLGIPHNVATAELVAKKRSEWMCEAVST